LQLQTGRERGDTRTDRATRGCKDERIKKTSGNGRRERERNAASLLHAERQFILHTKLLNNPIIGRPRPSSYGGELRPILSWGRS